ncbi:MAG: ABC transporter ATP-binding protein [Hyphomicrobium sp.]
MTLTVLSKKTHTEDQLDKLEIKIDPEARKLLRRFLVDWIVPRWKQLLLGGLLTALLAAATSGYPLVIKYSFDTLLKGNVADLPHVLTGIVTITLARSLFLYLTSLQSQKVVLEMTTEIQKLSFTHLMNADYARLVRDAPGRLLSKVTNDISFIQQATLAIINTVIRDALSVFALVCAMIYLDWVMSLVVLVVYPFAVGPIALISRRLRKNASRTQSELGGLTQHLGEKLSSIRLIKTYRLEEYAKRIVSQSFEEVMRLRLKAVSNRARLESLLEAFGGLSVAGVVWLAYWRIANNVTTVGDFMGFTTALLMSAQPIRAVGNLTARVQEGLAAIESFYLLLDEKPLIVDRKGAKELKISKGTLSFNKVSFRYENSKSVPAVEDFSLKVLGGQTIALVGRSGAGKSTVMNLVPRLFDVTEGSIEIDDQDLREVTVSSLRNAISIVSQDVTLFDDTILANIALGRLNAKHDEIINAAKAAAAHSFIMEQPQDYETLIGDRGSRLSGGQRQRIALARAILKNAPIFLLDEATSALDSESERLVQETLAKFTKNRTTLVIAHRLSTVEKADLICVMDNGKIIETGQHGELMARGGAYARLAQAQLFSTDENIQPPE